MPEGVLEVSLVSAKGLENTDVLCKGSNPEWKETFLFDVSSNDCMELRVKIMDSDGGVGADDFVGHTSISLDTVFRDGDIPAKSYNIMKDDKYCGEIRIGLNFTAQRSRGFDPTDGNIGGWKQSGRD
ncbi:elicitor-responsive protein 3-like protein [Tanacetum coccineum]|uniref:Elicitor-responsive protein 3-like protein n=1 Tax=Tanacetum coccineum TaxID=301880 RepID=A0ABQ4ZCP9_9ASTR